MTIATPTTDRPETPAGFPLTWHKSRRRWCKKIQGLGVKFFGRGTDPNEAQEHYDDYLSSGEYVTPTRWGNGRPTAATPTTPNEGRTARRNQVAATATETPTTAAADLRSDVPADLQILNVKRRANGLFYYNVPNSDRQISLTSDPTRAREKMLAVVGGETTAAGAFDTSVAECFGEFLSNLEQLEADEEHGKGASRIGVYESLASDAAGYFGGDRNFDSITAKEWNAFRSAVLIKYADTAQNRKLGRVGQRCALSYSNGRISGVLRVTRWAEKRKLIAQRDDRFDAETFCLDDDDAVQSQQADNAEQWERDELLALLDRFASSPIKRAIVLLGINCGLGNKDIAELTRDDLDLVDGWVTAGREKTNRPRRVKLWPETVAALQAIVDRWDEAGIYATYGFDADDRVKIVDLAKWFGNYSVYTSAEKMSNGSRSTGSTNSIYQMIRRRGFEILDNGAKHKRLIGRDAAAILLTKYRPTPQPGNEAIVFLTRDGERFVRVTKNENPSAKNSRKRNDAIRQMLRTSVAALEIDKGVTFYDIRHSFQTKARSTPGVSKIVVDFMMGHLGSKLVRQYTRDGLLPDDQIELATMRVREWLFDGVE